MTTNPPSLLDAPMDDSGKLEELAAAILGVLGLNGSQVWGFGILMYFDAYLYCDDKPVYQVQWEAFHCVGTCSLYPPFTKPGRGKKGAGGTEFMLISGKSVDALEAIHQQSLSNFMKGGRGNVKGINR